ncbi:LacI family transcriptional regulator [Pseudomonas aeruginosa]|nr:LacI family transcriptional regulator [Pseudomonas aeruginosa]
MNGSVLPSRGRVTINQVAEAAGVSKASVSRYIGGDRQLLADATARRIERAIDQLDYRPNQMARGLKRGRTRLIGMLVADILNPYSVAVMHGVETACREHGYSLVVCNTDRDDEQERHHLAALQSYNVEGLIVNTLGHHPGELRALHRELPMVLVDRQLAELDTDLVGLDNADAVEQALDHLQHRGFRDILLVTEPLDGTSSRIERVQAFNASIGRRPALKGQVLQTDDFFRDGLRAFLSASGPGRRRCSPATASPPSAPPANCATSAAGCSMRSACWPWTNSTGTHWWAAASPPSPNPPTKSAAPPSSASWRDSKATASRRAG